MINRSTTLNFVVVPSIEELTSLLAQTKQQVLLARTPREQFTWLFLQGVIEGIIKNLSQNEQNGV